MRRLANWPVFRPYQPFTTVVADGQSVLAPNWHLWISTQFTSLADDLLFNAVSKSVSCDKTLTLAVKWAKYLLGCTIDVLTPQPVPTSYTAFHNKYKMK
jgi:hypothetical protein